MNTLRNKTINALDRLPDSMAFCLFIISFVSAARLFEEWLVLAGKTTVSFGGILHCFGFYLCIFVLNVNNMSLILKREWNKQFGIIGIGVLLGLLPMCIDAFNPNIKNLSYIYFDTFQPFFNSPEQPIGETITLWIWIISFTLYIALVSASWIKTLKGLITVYCTVQFVSWFSVICKNYFYEFSTIKMPVDHFWTMWWLLIAFAVTAAGNWQQFRSAFKRIQHAIIWGTLVLLGAKLVGFVNAMSYWRAFIMVLSFLFILLVNDYYDKETDRVNERESGMTLDMTLFVLFCHFLLVLTAGHLDISMGILAFLFFMLGIAYSCPAVRLKKNFVMGSIVEGLGAMICILAGGTQFGVPLNPWFIPLVVLFGFGFMASSNLKDYKDFKGDLACGINTLYVLLYKRGWPIIRTNYMVSSVLTSALLIPCLILYILDVQLIFILAALVASIIPGVIMTRSSSPRAAVGNGIWSIIFYFLLLINIMPRLPV